MRRLLLKLARRRQLQDDLEAELAFHRELSARNGNPIPLGNSAVIKEEAFDLWRFTWIENLWRDVVYAARGLRRSPALVASALLSLALGIGANTAIFSLGVEFLLSEPSVTDSRSLIGIRLGGASHSKHHVVDFVAESGVFQDVAGDLTEGFVNWNDGNETRRIFGVVTTPNYFTALGIPVLYGRGYSAGDPREVVVLHHDFWRRHFHSDPSMVGRSLNLDGRVYTVIGILPPGHRTVLGFGYSPDVYLPRYLEDSRLAIIARLKPGMSLAEARARLNLVAQRLDEAFPEQWKYSRDIRITPVAGLARLRQQRQMQAVSLFFVMLLIVVGLVLLIACVNVASLLLARAAARRREIAVRLALGAGRGRLLQQLLVESFLLALLGAGLGLGLCRLLGDALAQLHLPLPFPVSLRMDIDWRVAAYAAILTVFATVICGLLPALQSLKESIASDFHREGKLRLRRTLVAAQIAISLVVLTTGFLFVRNLAKSSAMSPGFDLSRTVRAAVNLPVAYRDAAKVNLFANEALRQLVELPGIEAAAAVRIIPFIDNIVHSSRLTFPDTGEEVNTRFHWNAVSPDYFRAMDIPILRGRDFSAADRGGAMVVIVNRTFVERYLGSRDPLGATFLWAREGKIPFQIVGVVEGTRTTTIGEDHQPQIYEPLAQTAGSTPRIQFVLRSATPPATQLEAIRQVLRRLEPGAGAEVATLHSSIGLAFLPSQVGAILLGSMGAMGLLLAAIGLYGVMMYTVARRAREIGLRLAIGATGGHIWRMILLDAGRLIAAGSAVGLVISLFVTKPLAMFLVPGLSPADPISFAAVLLVMAVTALLATWGAVRRALAIDPMSALRCD